MIQAQHPSSWQEMLLGERRLSRNPEVLVSNQETMKWTVFSIPENAQFLASLACWDGEAPFDVLLTDKHLLFTRRAKLRARIETSRAT